MIPHFDVKPVQRSKGASVGAKARYVLREGRYARGRDDLDIVVSGNMPGWAEGNSDYWLAADRNERGNGVLARNFVLPLPAELSLEQGRRLAVTYAEKVSGGKHPYTLAVHLDTTPDQEHPPNHHGHLLLSERGNDGVERSREGWFARANPKHPAKGGAAKDRRMRSKQWLKECRKTWQETVNSALAAAGSPARIDLRKLSVQRDEAMARGDLEAAARLDRAPGVHRGPSMTHRPRNVPGRVRAVQAMERRAAEETTRDAGRRAEARRTCGVIETAKQSVQLATAADRRSAACATAPLALPAPCPRPDLGERFRAAVPQLPPTTGAVDLPARPPRPLTLEPPMPEEPEPAPADRRQRPPPGEARPPAGDEPPAPAPPAAEPPPGVPPPATARADDLDIMVPIPVDPWAPVRLTPTRVRAPGR